MTSYTRPETVLRRADELLAVNQRGAALAEISEVFSSRKFRSTTPVLMEPIMMRFVELCVDQGKGRVARDGLHFYKNAQNTFTPEMLEAVLQHFLELSRAKLREAIDKWDAVDARGDGESHEAAVAAVVEDLDATQTPESLLLSAFQGDGSSASGANVNAVTPWLRFLWEAHRTCLDVVRNNARFENLYYRLCLETFDFCRRFQRRTEFRRLCEILRSHLALSQKTPTHGNQQTVNLNDADTFERLLDLRFEQLNTAVDLELWQEAFRTMEDIHGVVSRSKISSPKVMSSMVSYCQKMAKVFAVGKNYRLLHAAALVKAYSLVASHKTTAVMVSDEDDSLQELALSAVLAVLSTPVGSAQIAFALTPSQSGAVLAGNVANDDVRHKFSRLTALLGLGTIPTRASLLADIVHRQALRNVPQHVVQLYTLLEQDFHPITGVGRLEPLLAQLHPSLHHYIEPLKSVVVGKIIQHVATSYSELRLSRVSRWCHFSSDSDLETRRRVESQLIEACRLGDVDARIDHRSDLVQLKGAKLFDPDTPAGPLAIAALGFKTYNDTQSRGSGAQGLNALSYSPYASALSLSKSQTAAHGPYKSIDLIVRSYVPNVAATLFAAVDRMPSTTEESSKPLDLALRRSQETLDMAQSCIEDQSAALLRRNAIIARRKDIIRAEIEKRDADAARERAQLAKKRAEDERNRQREEAKRREEERQQQTLEKVRHEQALLLAENLKKTGGIDIDTSNKENLDRAKIKKLQMDHDQHVRQVLTAKLEATVKRIDHLERAFRLEELPLLQKDLERQRQKAKDIHDQLEQRRIARYHETRNHVQQMQATLNPIMPLISSYISNAEKDARAAFEAKQKETQELVASLKAEHREKVLAQREHERKVAEEQKRIEDERRAAEEERIARDKAEREAQEKERQEKEQERKRTLEAKRAERDRAIAEAAERARREEEALQRSASATPAPRAPPAARPSALDSRFSRRTDLSGLKKPQGRGAPPAGASSDNLSAPPAPRHSSAPSTTAPPSTGGRRRLQLAPRTVPREEK